VSTSDTVNGSQSRSGSDGVVSAQLTANLATGSIAAATTNTNPVAAGVGLQALLYDTLTFSAGSFGGVFGSSFDLTITAVFDGVMSGTGPLDTSGVGGRIHLYGSGTTVDSGVFTDQTSILNFLFLGPDVPTCAAGVNGPDLQTYRGAFSFQVSCTATVTQADPVVRLFLNMPLFINGLGGTWDVDMLNTAALYLSDLGGRTFTSASGVFPANVLPTPVPEPASLSLMALGLLGCARAAMVRRRRS
jgi:hypothetical protein